MGQIGNLRPIVNRPLLWFANIEATDKHRPQASGMATSCSGERTGIASGLLARLYKGESQSRETAIAGFAFGIVRKDCFPLQDVHHQLVLSLIGIVQDGHCTVVLHIGRLAISGESGFSVDDVKSASIQCKLPLVVKQAVEESDLSP